MRPLSAKLLYIVLFAISVPSVGCEDDGDNYLKGSMTKTFDLGFDDTRVRLWSSELSIEYVSGSDSSAPVALGVAIRRRDAVLEAGGTYDLVTQGAFSRSGSSLPELTSGELRLDRYQGTPDSTVSGTFDAVFLTQDGTRQTLRGAFSQDLEVVE